MKRLVNWALLFSLCAAGGASAQTFTEDDRFAVTAGIELRRIQNFSVLSADSSVLIDPDQNFRASYQLQSGFGFGGVIRLRLSRIWNVESGLYFTRRRYRFGIRDLQEPFDSRTEFRVMGYEIPFKGLIYIQLGDQLFMNVAMGVALNFTASDVIAAERTYNIKGFKPAWVRLGILGNVGFEWRTEKDGYFYIGATWHQIPGEIMRTEVNYFRPAENSPGQFLPSGRQRGILDGTYFSIDLRYFINPVVKKKPKVNRVIPDWKNM